MARPRGFEPLASASGGQRSIHLSYGRITENNDLETVSKLSLLSLSDRKVKFLVCCVSGAVNIFIKYLFKTPLLLKPAKTIGETVFMYNQMRVSQ